MLIAVSLTVKANERSQTLWQCDLETPLRLVFEQTTPQRATFFIERGDTLIAEQDALQSYLLQTMNGVQLWIPANGQWYIFEEAQATTGITYVEYRVRSPKTGETLEYIECENVIISRLPEIDPHTIPPMPDDLFEWYSKISVR